MIKTTVVVLMSGVFLFTCRPVRAEQPAWPRAVNADMLAEIVKVSPQNGLIVVRNLRGSKLTRRFFGPGNKLENLRTGQKVRVYYKEGSHFFERIEIMTVLQYKEGQNLGNIYSTE